MLSNKGRESESCADVSYQSVFKAWESLLKQLITESFKSCGKRDESVASSRLKLQLAREEKKLAQLMEEVDLDEVEER
uniref:Uncharacterized protein n=1 Tax=Ditylenchus dipsaci TaxID=166011 RepID=A0A915E6B3_9BILA